MPVSNAPLVHALNVVANFLTEQPSLSAVTVMHALGQVKAREAEYAKVMDADVPSIQVCIQGLFAIDTAEKALVLAFAESVKDTNPNLQADALKNDNWRVYVSIARRAAELLRGKANVF